MVAGQEAALERAGDGQGIETVVVTANRVRATTWQCQTALAVCGALAMYAPHTNQGVRTVFLTGGLLAVSPVMSANASMTFYFDKQTAEMGYVTGSYATNVLFPEAGYAWGLDVGAGIELGQSTADPSAFGGSGHTLNFGLGIVSMSFYQGSKNQWYGSSAGIVFAGDAKVGLAYLPTSSTVHQCN